MVTVEFIFIDFLRLVLSQWPERQIGRGEKVLVRQKREGCMTAETRNCSYPHQKAVIYKRLGGRGEFPKKKTDSDDSHALD